MRLSSDLVGAASLSGYLDKRGQVNKDFKKRYDDERVSDCGLAHPHSPSLFPPTAGTSFCTAPS